MSDSEKIAFTEKFIRAYFNVGHVPKIGMLRDKGGALKAGNKNKK